MDFEAARAVTDRQTDTQDNYSNPVAHARRGLIIKMLSAYCKSHFCSAFISVSFVISSITLI